MRRQFKGERRVSAAKLAELFPINPNSRRSHHAAKVNERAPTVKLRRQFKMASIDRNELVLFVVKTMPRQQLVCVRNRDASEGGIIEAVLCRARQILLAEKPMVIERIDVTR